MTPAAPAHKNPSSIKRKSQIVDGEQIVFYLARWPSTSSLHDWLLFLFKRKKEGNIKTQAQRSSSIKKHSKLRLWPSLRQCDGDTNRKPSCSAVSTPTATVISIDKKIEPMIDKLNESRKTCARSGIKCFLTPESFPRRLNPAEGGRKVIFYSF